MALAKSAAILLFTFLQYALMAVSVGDRVDDLMTSVENLDRNLNKKLDAMSNLLTHSFGPKHVTETAVAVYSYPLIQDTNGHAFANLHLQDQCYKGMASLDTPLRTLVTIPGNRTALCDTATDGGGWIVFQRRSNGKEDFYRNWDDYKFGFGDVTGCGDYWLGNEILHQLTWRRTFELRVDMDHQGKKYYAQYSSFYLGDETTKYTLHVGAYSGDAGDNLSFHSNRKFSTYDMDSDEYPGNCAVLYHGAWWYVNCYLSNLNGAWGTVGNTGVNWKDTVKNGLSFTEMKIRLTG